MTSRPHGLRIATAFSASADSRVAIEEAVATLAARISAPQLILVAGAVKVDAGALHRHLRETFPGARLLGGSSCEGVMTDEGYSRGGNGIALLGLASPSVRVGVGAAQVSSAPAAGGRAAMTASLVDAGARTEAPALSLALMPPISEERILEGMTEAMGVTAPLVGGCVADEDKSGNWWQLTTDGVHRDAVGIATIHGAVAAATAFHAPYDPSPQRGRVSQVTGRWLQQIDGEPAARVYDRWTGGVLSGMLGTGGYILGPSNLFPFGRLVGKAAGIDYHELSHPIRADDGAILLGTDVALGDEVICMRSDVDTLVTRPGAVLRASIDHGGLVASRVRGAFVVLCAGCYLTVKDRSDEVLAGLRAGLAGAPFLVLFSFGEQGELFGRYRNGNLMTSSVVFADP